MVRHGKRVLIADLGCGDQKLLSELKQTKIQFEYQGYDLIPQSPHVKKINLNEETISLNVDIVAILGVIEYLKDISLFLKRLSPHTKCIILSYVVAGSGVYTQESRAALQWINDHTKDEIISFVKSAEYNTQKYLLIHQDRTLILLAEKSFEP